VYAVPMFGLTSSGVISGSQFGQGMADINFDRLTRTPA